MPPLSVKQRATTADLRPARPLLGILALLLTVGLVTLAIRGPWLGSETASAASGGAEMRIEIIAGSGGFCNGNDCYAEAGGTFTLGIDVVEAPAAGYSVVQTDLFTGHYDPAASEDGAGPNTCSDGTNNGDHDSKDRYDADCTTVYLNYFPRANAGEEFMDDVFAAAFRVTSYVGRIPHAGMTGLVPPVPTTYFEGRLLELDMSCPATPVATFINLLPFGDPVAETSGALFVEPDLQTPVTPKVNSLTVNCVSPQAQPGDTDGDGCSDAKEAGANPALGGDRDWLNPWDFYDTNGDGVIDLLFDILGVINHAGTAPGPPYDVNYDRGPWLGANSWNDTTPPDGVIDLLNDIYGVIAQNGHDCS